MVVAYVGPSPSAFSTLQYFCEDVEGVLLSLFSGWKWRQTQAQQCAQGHKGNR